MSVLFMDNAVFPHVKDEFAGTRTLYMNGIWWHIRSIQLPHPYNYHVHNGPRLST